MNKLNCIEIANDFRSKKGLLTVRPKEKDIAEIKHFSTLWKKYGLTEYEFEPSKRHFSFQEKFDCLKQWSENLFPSNLIDINYIHRKILNSESSIKFEQQNPYLDATSLVFYNNDDKRVQVNCIDLVPFEIDNLVQDVNDLSENKISEIKFNEYVETAEKNLSYHNDLADETALKYFKLALELRPNDNELNNTVATLDKIINHKNYSYPFDDNVTLKFAKLFVDCCNVKGFERLYDIISDDFVFIGKYFGRTKKAFIDSVYFESKSMMGLWTEIFQYENNNRQIPCVKLNDFGVMFFNIENDKIIRIFEYKIDDKLDRNKLVRWTG